MEQILTLDWHLLDAISKLRTPFLDFWIPKLTLLGNGGMIWILLAVVLLCIPKTRRCGQAMTVALMLVFLFGNCLLKPLIARPRPFMLHPEIPLLIPSPTDFSFPSGHTYAGIAAATVLWHFYKKWGWIALISALLIAFTRLYLKVSQDKKSELVFLGILCGFLAIRIAKRKG